MTYGLLDTNIVSYIVKRHGLITKDQPHLNGFLHAISFQTLAELWAGANLDNRGQAKRSRLAAVLRNIHVIQSTDSICMRFANLRVIRSNQPMSTSDAVIAATALAFNLDFVTHNPSDFQNIPSLQIITEAP